MGIVAGFLVQNALKYLLKFGEVSNYLGYNALIDFFPKMNLKPNPGCGDSNCVLRQKEFAAKPKVKHVSKDDTPEIKPVHEQNDWDISLVDESVDAEADIHSAETGVKLAYSASSIEPKVDADSSASDATSLEELMIQMKSM